jgi:hypothetical protein
MLFLNYLCFLLINLSLAIIGFFLSLSLPLDLSLSLGI